MNNDEILQKLNEIFVDTLDNEDIKLNLETTAADIEEWDSLRHIMLVVEIEKRLKIKFSSKEITKFKNVGDMVNSIASKF
tara:strand:- start:3937 stop:4176 length:240 start_codon:yes stop_codon:yes gene_type:complete